MVGERFPLRDSELVPGQHGNHIQCDWWSHGPVFVTASAGHMHSCCGILKVPKQQYSCYTTLHFCLFVLSYVDMAWLGINSFGGLAWLGIKSIGGLEVVRGPDVLLPPRTVNSCICLIPSCGIILVICLLMRNWLKFPRWVPALITCTNLQPGACLLGYHPWMVVWNPSFFYLVGPS